MNQVIVNGVVISSVNMSSNNSSIVMTNGKIIVNGVDVTPDAKEINVTVTGDVNNLEVGACNKVKITGNVRSVNSGSGDIEINGSVGGDIRTGSGDVHCGNVEGNVRTGSGNIKHNEKSN